MPLLIGNMQAKLPSYKNQVDTASVKVLDPEVLSVPMSQSDQDCKALVEVGTSVKAGQMIGLKDAAGVYVPIYSPVSGEVTGIAKKMSANLKPCDHVVIRNDFKNEQVLLEKTVNKESSKVEIIDFIKSLGLMETNALAYRKYDTEAETLIISLVEDDPYLVSDVAYAKDHQEAFALGVALVKKATGAKKAVIVSTSDDPFALEIEGSENRILSAVYPLNDEEVLKTKLNEKNGLVVEGNCLVRLGLCASSKLPVANVYVTVAGEAAGSPVLVSCPIGTSCNDLLACAACTEGTNDLFIGGPMTGTAVTKAEVVVNQIVNEVTVFPHEEQKSLPCLRCGKCAEVCPKGLIPVEIVGAFKTSNVEALDKTDIMTCSECGLCAYVCPSKIDVTENIRRAKRYYGLKRKK